MASLPYPLTLIIADCVGIARMLYPPIVTLCIYYTLLYYIPYIIYIVFLLDIACAKYYLCMRYNSKRSLACLHTFPRKRVEFYVKIEK